MNKKKLRIKLKMERVKRMTETSDLSIQLDNLKYNSNFTNSQLKALTKENITLRATLSDVNALKARISALEVVNVNQLETTVNNDEVIREIREELGLDTQDNDRMLDLTKESNNG